MAELRSLPSRERGLKSSIRKTGEYKITPSLPSRERGLKFAALEGSDAEDQSLPSRERGLKSLRVHEPGGREGGRSLRGSVD